MSYDASTDTTFTDHNLGKAEQMSKVKSVGLEELEGVDDIKFIRAEWKHDLSSFVLIRYARGGQLQPHGLALDLDKMVILDSVEDETLNRKIHSRTEQIWHTVVSKRGVCLRKLSLSLST